MIATMTAAGLSLPMAEGNSHFPPSPDDFWQPLFPMFTLGGHEYFFTRPMAVMLIATIGLSLFLWITTRRAAVVPSKGQWLTENVYNFARNGIARDMIGSEHFLKHVPLLFALFSFILANNLMGIIPPFQNPPMARIGFPIGLALLVYVIYHVIGLRKKGGVVKYLGSMLPPGLPGWIKPFIWVLEAITYFITRPLTLALRLFGNMFAGHMLLVVFIVGGFVLFSQPDILLKLTAIPAWVLGVALTLFEALVQFLQAYVFTLLAASYIGDALADEH